MFEPTVTTKDVSAGPLKQKVRQKTQSLEQKMSKLINSFLDEVLAEARRRVPVDEGDLKASGRKIKERGELHGYVIFGDEDAPHAAYVHEILTYHHDQGEAKYLENAIEDLRPEFIQRINATVGGASYSFTMRMLTRDEEDKFK